MERKSFETILKKLIEHEIRFIVVGGLAVALHGYDRSTGDIDILLALDGENLKKMDLAMKEMDYYPRIPVELHELSDRIKIERYKREKNMQAYTLTSSGQPPIQIDIIIEESWDFDSFDQRKTFFDQEELSLPVIALDDLLLMKKKTGREKDIIDYSALIHARDLENNPDHPSS